MEVALIHTKLDISKIDPFKGFFFLLLLPTIDIMNIGHVLTKPKSKNNLKNVLTWENGNN